VHKHAPETALIILTGLRDEEIGNRAVKEGAQDYLVKGPIDSKLLFKTINYGIERNNLVLDLARREFNLSALMENTTDSIWSTDIEGTLLTFNSKFQKLFKKYYGVEITEGIKLYDQIPADENKLWETVNNRILRKERFSFEKVYEFPGTSIYVEISVNPIISGDGSVMGASFFSRDITERKKTENSLRVTLEEKKVLLKEIHHRVKNNLMIISNLLYLQSSYIKDKESQDIFKESQNRARSMALIHERLYHSADLKRMDFGDYIRSLSTELLHTYEVDPGLIKLKINVEDIFLDINTAIPLGLIVNELVTNSLKHAFPEGNSGEINVDFHPVDDHYEFTVKDNGVGFPEDLDFQNTDSLGMQIVNSLTDQIDGEIELDNNNGTEFKISFKDLEV
jgi:PAS domain S-box-containing protein